jgi:hypothetical protein
VAFISPLATWTRTKNRLPLQRPRSLGPSAIVASSSRRVCIGYLVLAKAAEAGGDQTTASQPPLAATPMTGNSGGAPLEHLPSPTVCSGLESKVGFASWNLLFSQMGRRWAGSGSGPWGPQPTPWPTAAPGGAGREGGALHRPYQQQVYGTAALSPATNKQARRSSFAFVKGPRAFGRGVFLQD